MKLEAFVSENMCDDQFIYQRVWTLAPVTPSNTSLNVVEEVSTNMINIYI